jgi:glutamyl-tRNA reductase
MKISSASFAYPALDHHRRTFLAESLGGRSVPGAMVLSTCLRIELAVPGDQGQLRQVVETAFATRRPSTILEMARIRRDLDAVVHLFRVAAGLESPFVGEPEILAQFRSAVIQAGEMSGDGLFQKLLEGAVAVGRQVREEVLGDRPLGSIAAVAARMIGGASRVAVVGAGAMAQAVAAALAALPAAPEVVILARHPEKVAVTGSTAWEMERLEEVLARFPAVVSVTSAGRELVGSDRLSEILATRDEPLVVVDLAMPPDFRPVAAPGLVYYDVDRLAAMAIGQIPSEEADALITAAAGSAYHSVSQRPELGPLIGGMMSTADQVVEATVDRFAGRLATPADRAILNQAAHTVARRLLSGPVAYLKLADRHPDAAQIAAEMFHLD